jgi:hypothetical protein
VFFRREQSPLQADKSPVLPRHTIIRYEPPALKRYVTPGTQLGVTAMGDDARALITQPAYSESVDFTLIRQFTPKAEKLSEYFTVDGCWLVNHIRKPLILTITQKLARFLHGDGHTPSSKNENAAMSLKITTTFAAIATATILLIAGPAGAAPFDFNGAPDNQTDAHGYYYAITGGKFPTGNIPNGDNASGGTFRRIWDDPYWGPTTGVWKKDDWFPQNAGLALTIKNGAATLYDNNGIDAGTQGAFYDGTGIALSKNVPGLYRGYNMTNNYDHVYATYFKLETETTFDKIIGFFDENSGFDRNNPAINYLMNIWSATENAPNDFSPTVASFVGDVFSSLTTGGVFNHFDSGVDRIFGDDFANATDDIFQLEYTLNSKFTLAAGDYFFSHSAYIPEPGTLAIFGFGLIGLGYMRRRRAA